MDKAKQGAGLMVLGGALLVIGSFLDWAEVSDPSSGLGDSETGIGGGDGWFTLIFGAALLLVGYLIYAGQAANSPKWLGWLGWAGAVLGLALAVFEFTDINSDLDTIKALGLDGSLGIGVWLIIAGGVLGLIGAIMAKPHAAFGGATPPPPPAA